MNVAIQAILAKKSIMDYLAKKGIEPAKHMPGGKYAFFCPLPDHQDTKSPSFIVWTEAEYENFHCFGCQRGHSIIHLLSYMEGISFRDALKRLSNDLDISIEENIEFSLDGLNKVLLSAGGTPYTVHFDLPQKMLSISNLCRMYLDSVGYDYIECGIMEKFWEEIDGEVSRFDFSSVDDTLTHLPNVLRKRRETYEELKIEKQRKQYAS